MRKLNSLLIFATLSIGLFAIAGVIPTADAANENLFVSAENSQFDNYMSGPQVIEVIVIDSDINDTDEAKGEPDVTMNGKTLRMVQGIDGNWYGYFADRNMAQIADSTVLDSDITTLPTLPNSNNFRDIAVDSDSNLIYISNNYPHQLSVIDGDTDTLVTTIPIDGFIHETSVDSDSNLIYVSSGGYSNGSLSYRISVIDGNTNTIVATIPLNSPVSDIAVDSDSNLIYLSYLNSIYVINGNTNTIAEIIPVGSPIYSIAVDSDSNLIYFSNLNSISVIDGNTNTIVETIPMDYAASNIAVDSDSNLIYVPQSFDVSVIDGNTNTIVATIPLNSPVSKIAVDSDSNLIYVPQSFDVSVIDGNTNTIVTTIPIGARDIAVDSDSNLIYFSHEFGVSVIDGNTNTIIGSTTIMGTGTSGTGLDYGDFCNSNDGNAVLGIDLSDTTGFSVSNTGEIMGEIGSSYGGDISNNCIFSPGTPENTMNVLREPYDINPGNNEVSIGQIGLNSIDNWPFIQLYNLNPSGNVIIQYNKGGGVQTTTLTFDTVEDYASLEIDRNYYFIDSQVYPTITDVWLNIDPTDEDSWTFGTYGIISSNYQVFDEDGVAVGDTPENTDNNLLTSQLGALMCEDNCRLLINPNTQDATNPVLTLQDNDDTGIVGIDANDATSFQTLGGNLNGKIPITITETSRNSGVFVMHDESDSSILKITDNAAIGTSGTIDYNEEPKSIVVVLTPVTFCNDMTIDELITSGNYNVIDNRDGHLDGSKIKGTNGDDLILASDAGNDIRAKKGNDCVIGGAGNDQLRGGNGDDILFGLDGNDRMIGGNQNDLLYGGEGNDKMSGSKNNDQLFGENGDDIVNGGSGDDALSCGDGTDKANGGKGTDTATADCEIIKKVP